MLGRRQVKSTHYHSLIAVELEFVWQEVVELTNQLKDAEV